MRRTIRWLLFDTRAGNLVLRALERAAGLALVDLSEIDGERVRATALGRSSARVS